MAVYGRRSFALLASCGLVVACSSSSGEDSTNSPGANTSPEAGPVTGFSSDAGTSNTTPNTSSCAEGTSAVYVLDLNNTLQSFDPPTGTFSEIGAVTCPSTGWPYSMAISRTGVAWVLYSDGHLFNVSIKDASCSATSFAVGQSGFTTFGMGFATDSAEGTSEVLYVAGTETFELAKIALDTLTLTPVGSFDQASRMELTGTGAGQLFGLQEAAPAQGGQDAVPWTIHELSKSSATSLSTKPETDIPESSSNFAFAAWGGNFYSFVGSGIYRYEPSSGTVTTLTTSSAVRAVGAGVSTCAPHAVIK